MSEAAVIEAVVERCAPRGMISIRGDFADTAFADAISSTVGASIPAMRKRVALLDGEIVWMSPDELLLTCAYDRVDALIDTLTTALADVHHLVVNVSDARAIFAVSGSGWRDVLAKGMPVDFRITSFGLGQVRRSRLGQVAAAVWVVDTDRVELVCFRSVADFVSDWLNTAARDGSLPGAF